MSEHGTLRRYNQGCTCEPCRTTRAAWVRQRLAARQPTLQHGTRAMYDAGDRCELCRQAKRESRKS